MSDFLKIIFILISFYVHQANSQEIFILNPKSLKAEIANNPIRINEIESDLIDSQIDENDILETFSPQLVSKYQYQQTRQSFDNFFPVMSPYSEFEVGLEKTFQSGIEAAIGNMSYRRQYGAFSPESRNSLFIRTSIDLYKNFFGRTSKSQVKNAKLQSEISQIQSEIDKKIFEFLLLRTYYNIILNNEALKISKKILKLAQSQQKDLKNKLKNKIATIDDLQRQNLEILSEKAQILSLKKQRELYFKSLRELLPNISNKNLKLGDYNYDEIENKILKLILFIKSIDKTPLKYSLYDEILLKEKQAYKMQKKIDSTYNDIDVKLNAEFQRFNANRSLTDSYENIPSNSDSSYYNIGAEITVPFGKVLTKTEKLKNRSNYLSYIIKKEQLLSQLDAYHLEFIENANFLFSMIENQKSSSKSSKIILRESSKKYQQARISLQRLIDDQNNDLKTSLDRILISEQVLNLLFDYLTIFTLLDV